MENSELKRANETLKDVLVFFLQSGMCKFETIFCQNKVDNRRLASSMLRFDNVVLAVQTS